MDQTAEAESVVSECSGSALTPSGLSILAASQNTRVEAVLMLLRQKEQMVMGGGLESVLDESGVSVRFLFF